MNFDIVTIPNFFQNPEQIYKLALRQKFYTRDENPEPQFTEDTEIFYWGARTMPLNLILDPKTYDILLREYFDKVFQTIDPPATERIGFELNCLFHSLTNQDRIAPSDLHQDSSSYAGVVYLNDVSGIDPLRHGTIVMKDGEKINVPYEYNKLVLYKGSYWHSANSGFGDTLEDSRLTLNMFFNVKELE